MLSRFIALAIFLITTAAIHAEYYLIRVDLTKPLVKGQAAGPGAGVPMPPGGAFVPMPMPGGPGVRPMRPMVPPGVGAGEGGFSGGIIEKGEFTLNSRFVFTVVELNKRVAVPQQVFPWIIVDGDNKITQPGAAAGAGQPNPAQPGVAGAPPAVTDNQLREGHWHRFDHPWNGKTMPLVTTDKIGAITGEYFVPNSSMQFVQIISDESVKNKSIALPSISKIFADRSAALKDKKSVSDVVDKVGKFALEHGMTKEFKDTMDLLIKDSKGKSPILETYSKTKKATEEKGAPDPAFASLSTSFVGFNQEKSDHFEVIHDGLPNDPEVKLWIAQLEKNYTTFFMWFSLNGTQIELPKIKLSVVITTKPDVYNEMHLALLGNKAKVQGFMLPREKLLVLCTKRLDPISEMLGLKMKEWTTKGYDFNQLLLGILNQGHPPADHLDVAYSGALAVLNRALDQETVWNTIGNFGTLQLFYATKTLPSNVVLPKWFSEGLAGVFETPHCSPWMSFGSANSYHLPLFRQIYKNKRNPIEFEAILSRLLSGSKLANLTPQAGQEQFNTESWALVYFLVKKKQTAFMAFCKDFEMFPKDVVLSQSMVAKIFIKHFLAMDSADMKKAQTTFLLEWIDFIFTENLEGEKFFVDLRRIQSEMLKTQDLSVIEDPTENMVLRLLLEGGLETGGVPGTTPPPEGR